MFSDTIKWTLEGHKNPQSVKSLSCQLPGTHSPVSYSLTCQLLAHLLRYEMYSKFDRSPFCQRSSIASCSKSSSFTTNMKH